MSRLRGHGQFVLYLDFDGVLHPEDVWFFASTGPRVQTEGHTLFEHNATLVEVLEAVPEVAIVLSTAWVRRFGLAKCAKNLPPALRLRVVGATFRVGVNEAAFAALARSEQVAADVAKRRPAGWVAVDDEAFGWPEEHRERVVVTHHVRGLGDPQTAALLKNKLLAMCGRAR